MQRLNSILLPVAVILGACGCCAVGGTPKATRSFSLTAPWQDYQRVIVDTRNGSVELSSSNVPEIRIEGKTYVHGKTQQEADANLEQLEIVAEADASEPKTFKIELKVPKALKDKSPGASFVVTVPKPCAATVDTSNGAIRVANLKGSVVLDTSNGRIQAERIDGSLKADTSNGAVSVQNVTGSCVLDTSNGRIEVQDARGDVRADTSNAAISVDASPPRTGTVILDTSNGSIDATLPASMSASVTLDTNNGRVRADFGSIPADVHHKSNTELRASVNGGEGGKIVADTSNGSITLKFRK